MKFAGSLLIVLGIVWGVIAFNMTTSVKIDGKTIGSGESATYIESREVYNLSLASSRTTNLTIAAVVTIIGVILFGFGSIQSSATHSNQDARKCPFCAESIQTEAIICRHCKSDLSVIPKNPENLSEEELNKLIEKLKLK